MYEQLLYVSYVLIAGMMSFKSILRDLKVTIGRNNTYICSFVFDNTVVAAMMSNEEAFSYKVKNWFVVENGVNGKNSYYGAIVLDFLQWA